MYGREDEREGVEMTEKGIIEKYEGKMVIVRDNFSKSMPSGERRAWVEKVYPRKGMVKIELLLGKKVKVKIECIMKILSDTKPPWWGNPKKAGKIKVRKRRC